MIHKIKVHVSLDMTGRIKDLEIELDDDLTPEQIEKAKEDEAREWMFEQINWGYKDI